MELCVVVVETVAHAQKEEVDLDGCTEIQSVYKDSGV